MSDENPDENTNDESQDELPTIDGEVDMSDAAVDPEGDQLEAADEVVEHVEELIESGEITPETDPVAVATATPGATEEDIPKIREQIEERYGTANATGQPDGGDTAATPSQTADTDSGPQSPQTTEDAPEDDSSMSDEPDDGDDSESGSITDQIMSQREEALEEEREQAKDVSDLEVPELSEPSTGESGDDDDGPDFSALKSEAPEKGIVIRGEELTLVPPDRTEREDADDIILNLQESLQRLQQRDLDQIEDDDLHEVFKPVVQLLVKEPISDQDWEEFDGYVKQAFMQAVQAYLQRYVSGFTFTQNDLGAPGLRR